MSEKKEEARKAFVEWYATPSDERKIRTEKELAKKLDVHPRTMRRWKSEDWFQKKVRHKTLVGVAEDRADIYKSMAEEAKKGSYKHQRMFAKLIGDLVDQVDVTTQGQAIDGSGGNPRTMTTGQLTKHIKHAKRKKLQAKGFSDEQIDAFLNTLMDAPAKKLEENDG